MTKVLQRTTVATGSKSTTEESYKVAFWAVVTLAAVVGIMSFAALGVGVTKALIALVV